MKLRSRLPSPLIGCLFASAFGISVAQEAPAGMAFEPPARNDEMAAIAQVQADAQARVAELGVRLAAAPDDGTALELMREIGQTKRDAELATLRVQADFSRRAGRLEQTRLIEAAIAEFLAPPAPPTAADAAVERARPDQSREVR
jgi:hypothetical protein